MNRLAIHESAAPGLPPHELIEVARAAGFQSVGLRVAHAASARWWTKGAGAEELRAMVDRLLATRVSVLDVGRAELHPDGDEATTSVLDLAARLGARYVTVVPGPDVDHAAVTRLFAGVVDRADTFALIPLLVPTPGTVVGTVEAAVEIARGTGGGVMLDVSLGQTAEAIEDLMLLAGNRLGYLRVHCEDLDAVSESDVAGRMATVPVHVPIAVGSGNPTGGSGQRLAEHAARWRHLVDRMLEHPRARAARESGQPGESGDYSGDSGRPD